MRLSLRRLLVATGLIFLILVAWTMLREKPPQYTRTCIHSEAFQTQLHRLTASVDELLRQLDLTHFLCYGALWGQIRLGRTLPWADKAELCILNEEIVLKDEVFIHRLFKKKGLSLDYDSSDGSYTVTGANDSPKVVLIVFELDKLIGMYRRVGWKRRLLPPDCENFAQLECFPPRLAVVPLPLKQFGTVSIPIPRENIEIQKYHYRDSWWKEVPQLNC